MRTADYIMFHTAVHEHHGLVAIAMNLDFLAAYLSDKIFLVWVIKIDIATAVNHNLTEH